jgi:hypothetical protein
MVAVDAVKLRGMALFKRITAELLWLFEDTSK